MRTNDEELGQTVGGPRARARGMRVARALGPVAALLCLGPAAAYAADIGIYWNAANPQQDFAAGDVKAALTAKSLTWVALTSANVGSYVGDKVIIGKDSDSALTGAYGSATPALSVAQETGAFDLRNVTSGSFKHLYAVGYDDNGAMYAGLQIAEEIKFVSSFAAAAPNVLADETPTVKKRAIKLNIPFDSNHPTYNGSNSGDAFKVAVQHIWDMSFWQSWFDDMARNRFNALSMWTENPLRSMVDMSLAGTAKCKSSSFANVQVDNGPLITMTLAQKIQFWKDVMTYGKNRGFEVYLMTWNIKFGKADGGTGCVDGTDVTRDASLGATDSKRINTVEYFRKGFKLLLETYPDLAGIGVTAGEGFQGGTDAQKEQWLADTYGEALNDVLNANTTRKLVFIHRAHQTDPSLIWSTFSPKVSTHTTSGRLKFDYSFKYSEAHMHSAAAPGALLNNTTFTNAVCGQGRQTWLEMRNDDFHFLQWADSNFARDYISNIPKGNATGCSANPGFAYAAFLGADGWVDTRDFSHKQTSFYGTGTSAKLKEQRHWFRFKVWGRAMYNSATPDAVFKNHLALRHGISATQASDLFTAWNKASRAVQLINELVVGNGGQNLLNRSQDEGWWPEFWSDRGPTQTGRVGYLDIASTRNSTPAEGATVCKIKTTATGSCGTLIPANTQTDNIKNLARGALALLNTANFSRTSNTELDLNLLDIEALSHLGLYGANKIKAAYNLEKGLNADADADAAYCVWKTYTGQMADMYTPAYLQRNLQDFSSWSQYDSGVLSDAGGSADCVTNYPVVTINSPANNGTIKTTNGTLSVTAVAGSRVDVKVDGLTKTSQIATGSAQTFVIPTIPVGAGRVIQVRVYETDGDFTSKTITVTASDTAPSCADNVQNNGETQVDCGGANCGACAGGSTPTCTDGILNNGETQTDCGGPNCSACGTSTTLINASFTSGSDGFTYADDVWATSSDAAKAAGNAVSGKVNVVVGGSGLANTATNMNGGWSKTFTTTSAGPVSVSLKYSITSDLGIDPGEWVEARVKIDGTSYGQTGPLGTGVNIFQIEAGGDKVETTYTFTSSSLTAGNHTITVGAFMNSESSATETGTITFDDVIVTASGGSGPTCSDGVQNGTETGVDCGGSCSACAPTCSDGVKNGSETDIDCGGTCTADCANGKACSVNADCQSSLCSASVCTAAPTCSDGVKNGTETGVDCGGSCSACAPTCSDGIQNGTETGVDCGGSCSACGATNFWKESECRATSQGGYNTVQTATSGYSGTGYIVSVGNTTASTGDASADKATYTVTASVAGAHKIWFRLATPSGNSIFYRLAGGTWVNLNTAMTSSWAWYKGQTDLTLVAGANTIEIANREGGLQIDKIYVTSTTTTPTGTGTAGTCP